jgi:hypothetical protein
MTKERQSGVLHLPMSVVRGNIDNDSEDYCVFAGCDVKYYGRCVLKFPSKLLPPSLMERSLIEEEYS